MGARGQRGWSMTETVLVVGIMVVLGVGVMSKFSATARQAAVSAASLDVRTLAGAVEAAYSHRADFSGLSSASFVPMAPDGLLKGGELRTDFGPIVLAEETGATPGVQEPSFRITLRGLDPASCSELTARTSEAFHQIWIGGQAVGGGASFVPAMAVAECARAATTDVGFVHRRRKSWVPCFEFGTRETEIGCPSGMIGSRTERTVYSCPTGYEPGVWGAPVQGRDTCV